VSCLVQSSRTGLLGDLRRENEFVRAWWLAKKKAVTDDGDPPAKNKRALSWQNSADKQ